MECSIEVIREATPKEFKKYITDEFVDRFNSIDDESIKGSVKQAFVDYISIMSNNSTYSLQKYMDAIKYVTYKHYGRTDKEAYIATFPERYQRLIDEGKEEYVHNYTLAYSRNKIVAEILEMCLIPDYIMNLGNRQRAINALMEVINNPKEKGLTRVKACDALLGHTAPPVNNNVKIDVEVKKSDEILIMQETIANLAKQQRDMIVSNSMGVREIVEASIIDVEVD